MLKVRFLDRLADRPTAMFDHLKSILGEPSVTRVRPRAIYNTMRALIRHAIGTLAQGANRPPADVVSGAVAPNALISLALRSLYP